MTTQKPWTPLHSLGASGHLWQAAHAGQGLHQSIAPHLDRLAAIATNMAAVATARADDRVRCVDCQHLVAATRCRAWQSAGLHHTNVAAIRHLPQRCPAHADRTGLFTESKTEAPTETTTETPQSTQLEESHMIVSETATGASFAPCPAGSYLARCVRLVDLGIQTTDYQGETKHAHKVLIAFEVLDPDTRRDDGTSYVLSKRYTMSLHEKAALRRDLAGWRGRDFTPEELRGFDLRNILGAAALLGVVHTTKGDRTYANISSVMRVPKGMNAPEATEPLLHWDMSAAAPDWSAFAQLHPKLAEQIEQSPEFARLRKPASVPMPAPAAAPAQAGPFDDMADDAVAF